MPRKPFYRRVAGTLRAAALLALSAVVLSPAGAQMKTGREMKNFDAVFGIKSGERTYPYTAHYLKGAAPAGILWPGEQGEFTFQLQNHLERPVRVAGKVELIAWGTKGIPGDIWLPEAYKIADVATLPIDVDMAAGGWQNVTVRPQVPARLGGYALVVDLGEHGRQFVTSFVRTFAANPQRLQYPSLSLDYLGAGVLRRLGIQAVRHGIEYVPTDSPRYAEFKKRLDDEMRRMKENNITALLMVGAGPAPQPLGRPRPHLSDDGVMAGGKSDMAWLPEKDADFQKFVREISAEYGWPKGPVTAFSLWNEPWEGLSISGWGADMARYRELYLRMAQGVREARKQAKVDVLVAGADSSSNTFDKLFADGTDAFLPYLDAVTIHYQGMHAPSTHKKWIGRKEGRVKVWDTESWVANVDDRVAAVVATNRSSGYDRAMGVYGGNIAIAERESFRTVFVEGGKKERIETTPVAWPLAAAVGAAQHFIGERPFREILFKSGLPWVMVFDGQDRKVDDGTVVVVGDIGEEFGADNVAFRTVRGLAEVRAKEETRRKLAALPADSLERPALEKELRRYHVLSGASMTLDDADGAFSLYDFTGNPVPAQGGRVVVPLDHRGFFLRPSGRPGSFNKLIAALKAARIDGYEPLETVALDMTAPIEEKPVLRLRLTNVLNRPVNGALDVRVAGLTLDAPGTLAFQPHETREVAVRVTGGAANPQNAYPLTLRFDAGADGVAVHEETMHVNVVSRRTVKVDGDLEDWKGALPQGVAGQGTDRSLAEAAWFPFVKFDENVTAGFATGYLGYDKDNFYFAAKIADATPEKGTLRFASRDDDAYFYPAVSYEYDNNKTLLKQDATLKGASDTDKKLLQLPGGGRSAAYWENTKRNLAFAVDLGLPADRLHRVAVYLGGEYVHPNAIELQMLDAKTGRELSRQRIDNLWGGTYAVYEAAGDVRLRLKTNGDWYTVKLFGILLDPAQGSAPAAPHAKFVRWDHDTKGDWIGVYGKAGHYIVGAEPKLPAGVTVTVPEAIEKTTYTWPDGVRRYSYRTWPVLPTPYSSANYDSVQIAFNAVPVEREDMLPNPPGTPRFHTDYKSTDYEYSLHAVAPEYGGGTEVWRLLSPGQPRKHFYPRQPKSPQDGPVSDAKLVVRHDANTRIVECALPWSELPDVKKLLDAGKPVKFSFRVNDAGIGARPELGTERSVAKRSGLAFHVDWSGGWTNEIEFGWEGMKR